VISFIDLSFAGSVRLILIDILYILTYILRMQVQNLTTNCTNLKQESSQMAKQCRMDQQMLAELHDKHQLLRQEKGASFVAFASLYCVILVIV